MKYLVEYLVECPVKCSVKSTPQPHEQTQALYQRFGMSGGHLLNPPVPSERRLYIKDLAYEGEPPGPSKRKLYIRDLAYQGNTPLNPPVRANAGFISQMWHIRGTAASTPRPDRTP